MHAQDFRWGIRNLLAAYRIAFFELFSASRNRSVVKLGRFRWTRSWRVYRRSARVC